MPTIFAEQALLPDGWADDVRIMVEGGAITAVTAKAARAVGDTHVAVAVPGVASLHSHAFQRGMAGLAEVRGATADTFWTWREVMYRFALGMTPDDAEAVAAYLYCEMLEAGFTRVGEFHYLHHDRDGRPYANVAEMAERIAAAAATSGIGLTLLPCFYAHATFGGAPPHEGQRRFICDVDLFARLHDASRSALRGLDGSNIGVAPHSLRAVTPEELTAVAAIGQGGVVHIHAAEQVKEVEDCFKWSFKRPVQWLLENMPVDEKWCLIHATHMTDEETRRLAQTGAVAGLCPITEGSLGDGVFPARDFLGDGGRFGIGTDSNVLVGITDELRQLEYAQRLKYRERNVLAGSAKVSTGRALFDAALAGGAQALDQGACGLAKGCAADIVALDGAHPSIAGRRGDAILDGWIFATARNAVNRVWARGREVVTDGRHIARATTQARFNSAVGRLLA